MDVAVGGGHAEPGSGGRAGVGITVAHLGDDEQGLAPEVRPAPPGSGGGSAARSRSDRWVRVELDKGMLAG